MVATGIAALALAVAGAIVVAFAQVGRGEGRWAALVLTALLAAEWAAAASGIFHRWETAPPPLVPVVAGTVIVGVVVALSRVGRRLLEAIPLPWIVGFQTFRLPLEVVMQQAASDGLMPAQMSFTGWNFDIVTGATAIVVALAARATPTPRWLVVAWNALGSALLVAIMTIAVASTPTFAAFGPDRLNVWIADPPYVWLPGLLVPAAFFGHVLLWRRLWWEWQALR